MATAELTPDRAITLRRLEQATLTVGIEGTTPLIPHRWSEKAIRMMAEKQQQTGVKQKREAKNPDQEAYDSCYWLGDEPAMPATAFKAAMVGACRFFEGLTMTQAKLLFYVEGEGPEQLVRVKGDPAGTDGNPYRTDTPRNATGVADLRYRYAFYPWAATLRVRFLPSVITKDSVMTLIDGAGYGGVGDWRPSAPKSATGTFGQFRVVG